QAPVKRFTLPWNKPNMRRYYKLRHLRVALLMEVTNGSRSGCGERRSAGLALADEAAIAVRRHVDFHDGDDHPAGAGHLGRASGGRGLDPVVERVSRLSRPVVLVRTAAARPEYLLAVRGLDGARRRRDPRRRGLRMIVSPASACRS